MSRTAFRPAAALAALALAGAGIAATAAPAAAAGGTAQFKITEQELDFGDGIFLAGAPSKKGELSWTNNTTSRDVTLAGKIFINNASGTCARMAVEYRNLVGTLLETDFGGTVCASNGSAHSWTVNLTENVSSTADTAKVIIQVQTAGGSFITAGSHTVNL